MKNQLRAWKEPAVSGAKRAGSQPRAGQANVNVSAGRATENGVAESDVRHAQTVQQAHEPAALRLIRILGHINPVAVIEAQAAMHGGFAPGAYRQGMRKLLI